MLPGRAEGLEQAFPGTGLRIQRAVLPTKCSRELLGIPYDFDIRTDHAVGRREAWTPLFEALLQAGPHLVQITAAHHLVRLGYDTSTAQAMETWWITGRLELSVIRYDLSRKCRKKARRRPIRRRLLIPDWTDHPSLP